MLPVQLRRKRPVLYAHFASLFKTLKDKGFWLDGTKFKVEQRPSESGFSCDYCSTQRRKIRGAQTVPQKEKHQRKLRVHLQKVYAARKALAESKFWADQAEDRTLVMIDAADRAKMRSPSIREGGRAGQNVKKIIAQQFIGVIVYGKGYYIYRRMPVTQKVTSHLYTCTLVTSHLYT